jgi:uncharacterized protein DUF5335
MMRIEEVPPTDWAAALNEFTLAHEGWLTSMASFASERPPRSEITNLPLIGISAVQPDDADIAISVARSSVEHVTHVIERAAHVYVQRGTNGATASLIVDSEEGTRTVLRVRAPAEPTRTP